TSAAPSAPDTSPAPGGAPDGGNRDTASPSAPPTTAKPSPSATGGLPAGFRVLRAPEGFSVALPAGWDRLSTTPGADGAYRATFGADGDPRTLAVTYSERVGPDPVAVWRDDVEPNLKRTAGYERIGAIRALTYQGRAAADMGWYSTAGGTRVRTLGRGFLLGGGRRFPLRWTTPAADWATPAGQEALRPVLRTSRPGTGWPRPASADGTRRGLSSGSHAGSRAPVPHPDERPWAIGERSLRRRVGGIGRVSQWAVNVPSASEQVIRRRCGVSRNTTSTARVPGPVQPPLTAAGTGSPATVQGASPSRSGSGSPRSVRVSVQPPSGPAATAAPVSVGWSGHAPPSGANTAPDQSAARPGGTGAPGAGGRASRSSRSRSAASWASRPVSGAGWKAGSRCRQTRSR